jgi:hypothetical protein
MEENAERFEEVTQEVSSAGTAFGHSTTGQGCLAEMVRRVGGCEGDPMCGTAVSPFLWSCLEAAPRRAKFCAKVPAAANERALKSWGLRTCDRYGRPRDQLCALVLGLTNAFCSTQ